MDDDAPINVAEELTKANARLPLNIDPTGVSLEMQMRTIALTIAQRHVSDTVVKEGSLYQQLKMDNKLGDFVSVDHVLRAALVFERYLWGEWSRGIADRALAATLTEVADIVEDEFKKKGNKTEPDGEEPIRPYSGGPE